MSKKYVRPFTPAWRWLIGVSSVGAFLGGWALLAHTPNPYETAQASDAPALQEATPMPLPGPAPSQDSQRNTQPRQVQPLPTQVVPTTPVTSPQIQPNTQIQPSTTRTRRQTRLRSGGS